MTDRYVLATGSNTAPYETRAKAATSLKTAADAAAANEKIYIGNTHSDALTVDTTYTLAAGVQIISFDAGDTAEPPTTYAAGATITANATAGVDITINGAGLIKGLTIISGGSSGTGNITFAGVDASHLTFENCTVTVPNTNSGSVINIGSQGASGNTTVITRNCTFKFGHVNQDFFISKRWVDEGSMLVDGAGSIPTRPFTGVGPGFYDLIGSDLSACSGVLFGVSSSPYIVNMVGCKIHASSTLLDTTSDDQCGEIFAWDCASGDTHYNFRHHSHRGTTTVSVAIAMNTADAAKYDGTNPFSVVITGNANARFDCPYYSPWVEAFHDDTGAITPYFEVLRDGDAGAYTNAQCWAEWFYKGTSGSTRMTFATDRVVPLAAAANQADGAGLASWAGEGGSAKSMKLDTGAAITPAELGGIRGRIGVVGAIAVYWNPKILGLGATAVQVERALGAQFVNTNVTTSGGGASAYARSRVVNG